MLKNTQQIAGILGLLFNSTYFSFSGTSKYYLAMIFMNLQRLAVKTAFYFIFNNS